MPLTDIRESDFFVANSRKSWTPKRAIMRIFRKVGSRLHEQAGTKGEYTARTHPDYSPSTVLPEPCPGVLNDISPGSPLLLRPAWKVLPLPVSLCLQLCLARPRHTPISWLPRSLCGRWLARGLHLTWGCPPTGRVFGH